MMRGRSALLMLVMPGLALALAPVADAATGGAGLSANVARTRISTELGRTFVVRSTISNHGAAGEGVIAHLNVLSLRAGVYVDPEDWSTHRTRYLGRLPAGGSRTVTWRLKAVSAGSFGVYVAVLRPNGTDRPPVTGPLVSVGVAGRKTLNAGGILSVALGVPAVVALVTAALMLRRRRA